MEKRYDPKATRWYAVKTFYQKLFKIKQELDEAGYRTYVAMRVEEIYKAGRLQYVEKPLVASLLFVECSAEFLMAFKRAHDSEMMFYSAADAYRPAPIDDAQMRSFILVTAPNRETRIEFLGESVPDFKRGEHVRVLDGIYKGAEGYIKKIKSDRKLLVEITGIAVVAVSYIHPSLLEKIA